MVKIPKLSPAQITAILKTRKLENLSLITSIEKIFQKKRGFRIKVPPSQTPVILIVSGGLDSIIVWGYLMLVYKLVVYPVFINRGQRRAHLEEQAVDFFYDFYRQRLPDYCQPVQKFMASIPPMEIRFPITINSNTVVSKSGRWRGIPMYSAMLVNYAVQYAYYLEITQHTIVRTIFAGFMATDGLVMKDETLTAVRMSNLAVAELTEDYSWQVIALPLEKELGFLYGKEQFIRWATAVGIPLEKTRSCIMWNKLHCGECISCSTRKEAFAKAKIADPTQYKHYPWRAIRVRLGKIKRWVLSVGKPVTIR